MSVSTRPIKKELAFQFAMSCITHIILTCPVVIFLFDLLKASIVIKICSISINACAVKHLLLMFPRLAGIYGIFCSSMSLYKRLIDTTLHFTSSRSCHKVTCIDCAMYYNWRCLHEIASPR